MSVTLSKQDFDQLIELMLTSNVVRNPLVAQTFIDSILVGSPREMDIASDITLGGNARTTAVNLIMKLCKFGQDMPGRESLVLLVDGLKPHVGNEQHIILNALAARYGLTSSFPISKADEATPFEKFVHQSNAFKDVALWRARLGDIERQVCRIRTPCYEDGRLTTCNGTGFLVAANVVLTNWHVVSDVIAEPGLARDVRVQFDYKVTGADDAVSGGEAFGLAEEGWLIDATPMDEVDRVPDPKPREADPDRLDYAFLRLAGRPGDARGWVREIAFDHDFSADRALFIVQHPYGQPMKLALDTEAVVGVNANRARVRYRTNTEPGSSGSPCFNQKWELVALHHSGEPVKAATWNEGIPIAAILGLLEKRGKRAEVGRRG